MKTNEQFTLTLEPITGLELVKKFGYGDGWKFTGKEITKKQTKTFKLVEIGYQKTFEDVKNELKKHGTIPQGQWMSAFKDAYPDGVGEWVAVADSSWVDPSGDVSFPYVLTDGGADFGWAADDFYAGWRWLVEVQASELGDSETQTENSETLSLPSELVINGVTYTRN